MMLSEFVFAAIVGITIFAAFLAVWLKNVFYNALSLILCLFGVACLFIYLNCEFLAVMEIIIYIGAISIAIIFAIMLSQPMTQKSEKRNPVKIIQSLLLSILLFVGLLKTFFSTNWPIESIEGDYSIAAIGKSLLGKNILPFEAVSVVLLIAIIGALLLSRKENSS